MTNKKNNTKNFYFYFFMSVYEGKARPKRYALYFKKICFLVHFKGQLCQRQCIIGNAFQRWDVEGWKDVSHGRQKGKNRKDLF